MKLKYIETEDFVIFDKPSGLNSHAVDSNKEGLAEFLIEKFQQKLFIVSRLDQTTSGLVLLAKSHSVERISKLWEEKKVKKKYLFLTSRELGRTGSKLSSFKSQKLKEIEHTSYICKNKNTFQSLQQKPFNAHSLFCFQGKVGPYFLWQVEILTGKTHQIRLHAQDLGIPILGDEVYGGDPFYRVCLHSYELEIENKKFHSLLPDWGREESLNSMLPLEVLEAIDKRKRNHHLDGNECFRWLHQEMKDLRLDQFGRYLYLYDYAENMDHREFLVNLSKELGKSIFWRKMQNRGKDPNQDQLLFYNKDTKEFEDIEDSLKWIAQENNINYEFFAHQGLSPGLFLDQRENRQWIFNNAKNKNVLNLFSYTGGFSVCAALGGANTVDSVDVSKNFISWSKENFLINEININTTTAGNKNKDQNIGERKCENGNQKKTIAAESESVYKFWTMDVLEFLKIAKKKERVWDLIICDPPTFGRSQRSIFKFEDHYGELLRLCLSVLNHHGIMLFSTNYEKWTITDLQTKIFQSINKEAVTILKTPFQGLDFDYPHQKTLMKSVLIKKLIWVVTLLLFLESFTLTQFYSKS